MDLPATVLPRHILILTCGLPRSGKSTWARAQNVPIVSPDSVRYALHGQRFQPLAEGFVWASAKLMVRSLFLAGHSAVILDATSITRKRRDEWLSKDWGLFFKVFDTPKEECIERSRRLDGDYFETLKPVIERMSAEWEPLGADEKVWQ